MTALKNGDRDRDFREYVLARRDVLLREAYLLTGDAHLAEDLVQTAFTKAYLAWPKVRASDSPDAYVRRIMINANTSWFRKRRVAEVLTESAVDPDFPVHAEDHASRLDLLAALLSLPARQRAAVVLRYWADLPEGEVARIMDSSIGTVRSQSFKGLAKLRVRPELQRLVPGEV